MLQQLDFITEEYQEFINQWLELVKKEKESVRGVDGKF